jgi:spore coat polysaccharide biosynthesis predicted glycosyltransferase SpsG
MQILVCSSLHYKKFIIFEENITKQIELNEELKLETILVDEYIDETGHRKIKKTLDLKLIIFDRYL